MALSMILKRECSTCGKIAVEASRMKIGSTQIIKLQCGHMVTYTISANSVDYDSIVFSDGKKPRPYQIDCMEFQREADWNCIIADEQGLGKTIESSCSLRLHFQKLLPAVIVVPTTVKLQWLWELIRICVGENPTEEVRRRFLTQVIQSGKEKALPGFGIYVVTFDMLKKEELFDFVPVLKTVIIDECQRIKNHLSDRAKAVQRIAKRCNHVIPMSGTPIKNNAGEYFTILNLVAPLRFPNYQRFLDEHCDTYDGGYGTKVGGLKNPAAFHELTKDIIIRRTKEQVLKDLPSLDRKFFHCELDKKLNKVYAQAMQELEDIFYADMSEFERSSQTLAIMARMRHITGISKVAQCVDWTTDFLMSCERKLTIFVHHQDTGVMIESQLKEWCKDGNFNNPLVLHSGLSADERARLVERFKEPGNRVLIASTLAAGEGLNLQFCSDAVILERQWNPANEEQAEARFHRFGQENNVSITYMLATETIDEYFSELVEQKRAIVAAALDNRKIEWEQQSLVKELTSILISKGKKKWTL